MGKIKSALELAMEKTADLKSDKAALRKNEINREGKISLSRYLENSEKSDLPSRLKNLKGDEALWFKTGVMDTVLANLTLPRAKGDLEKLPRLQDALLLLTGKRNRGIKEIFTQLQLLLNQYLENMDQLEDSLAQQYEPRLRQKEMQLRQQTGQEIHLSPEQDPDFMKLLSEQISRMDDQYGEVLKQAKEQIRQEVL